MRSTFGRRSCSLVLDGRCTGLIYPAAVTGIAQALFPRQANGSLIVNGRRRPSGSALIGQPFDDPKYFWGRPSATAPFPYNAAASSGSNLGPTNPALEKAVRAGSRRCGRPIPGNTAPVPVDLVTASGSGLDPDISPAAALYQVPRVAKARGLDEAVVRHLVEQYTTGPAVRLPRRAAGERLRLNLALDAGEVATSRSR